MHLAAACTNGKLLPNMERMEPFNVIYQTAEDGLGDTVKPRLIEAGADLDLVLVIDDSDVQLTLSDERIEKAIMHSWMWTKNITSRRWKKRQMRNLRALPCWPP